jgi:hypothetical protein
MQTLLSKVATECDIHLKRKSNENSVWRQLTRLVSSLSVKSKKKAKETYNARASPPCPPSPPPDATAGSEDEEEDRGALGPVSFTPFDQPRLCSRPRSPSERKPERDIALREQERLATLPPLVRERDLLTDTLVRKLDLSITWDLRISGDKTGDKHQRPLTPEEKVLGKRHRSNPDGDGPAVNVTQKPEEAPPRPHELHLLLIRREPYLQVLCHHRNGLLKPLAHELPYPRHQDDEREAIAHLLSLTVSCPGTTLERFSLRPSQVLENSHLSSKVALPPYARSQASSLALTVVTYTTCIQDEALAPEELSKLNLKWVRFDKQTRFVFNSAAGLRAFQKITRWLLKENTIPYGQTSFSQPVLKYHPHYLKPAADSLQPTSIEVQPFHYNEMLSALSVIKKDSMDLEVDGHTRPRVLIINENGSEIASMFYAAGADVITSDPSASCDKLIPHYEGDSACIQDAGFDLVIIRTPKLGDTEPSKPLKTHYVAIETHSLHAEMCLAIGGTTQVVRPWEHGTSHTKPMLLYLSKDLPPLQPACVMMRVRTNTRSTKTGAPPHEGIVGAMALQWMPVLLERISTQQNRSSLTACEMIEHHLSEIKPNTTTPVHAKVLAPITPGVKQLPRVRVFKDHDNPDLPPFQTFVSVEEAAEITANRKTKRDRLGQPVFLENTHLGPSTDYKPWLEQLPRLILPRRPVRHVRRIRTSWKAWRVIDEGPEARVYGWVPLADTLNAQLNIALSDSDIVAILDKEERMPESTMTYRRPPLVPTLHLVLEEWTQEPDDSGWDSNARGSQSLPPRVVAPVFTGNPLHLEVVKLWETSLKPPDRATPRLGIGATRETTGTPGFPKSLGEIQRKRLLRAQHNRFTASSTHTVAAVTMEIPSCDVTETPTADCSRHCLFISDFIICRRQGESTYLKDTDLRVPKALADTGAGPSVITTDLIALMPKDASIDMDHLDPNPNVCGADGNQLTTHGHATIVFALAGLACRHRFLVIEGAPMLLLGNDFLHSRDANIQLSKDGPSSMILRSQINGRDGHSVPVTTVFSAGERPQALTIDTAPKITKNENTLPPLEKPMFRQPIKPLDFSTDPKQPQAATNGLKVDINPIPGPPAPTGPHVNGEVPRLHKQECLLFTSDSVHIPKRSKATFLVKLPESLQEHLDAAILVDRLPDRAGLENPPLVEMHLETPTPKGDVYVTVWNISNRPVTLPAFSAVAAAYIEFQVHEAKPEGTDPADSVASLTPAELDLLDSVKLDPDNHLTTEQREKVRQLLARRIAAFALNPADPGHTHLMQVELPLLDGATAHRHAPSRLGDKGQEITNKCVADMESSGIIRKSNSAWSSRVVLVSKKDGAVRFCVDYRDLNSKLRLSDSPLPLTAEAIDRLSSGNGSRDSLFLCTLDLASGFWCMPVKEEDKHKTAFSTHNQKYEFNYLPFGVQSGPSYMCRLMDAVLQGLAWEMCMPYLDDIGIWSNGTGATLEEREQKSFEQMLHRLDLILERLIWAGLTCKATKCVLFAISAEYLGHIISRAGLEMAPSKIEAVSKTDVDSISSIDKVRSFLGLCSYYRRFIKGFSTIATPLTDLTKKDVDVEKEVKTEPCQTAIRTLIKAITSAPVMTTPRSDREFIVKTDAASKEGLGGVLSQVDDQGHEKVIAYYGRRLNSAERNYSVTEIELLAALESIRHWRPYLWGRKFKLVVDHAALRWLHTLKSIEGGPASRLTRWALKLAEYRFVVEHKPGAMHKDADGISRLVACVADRKAPLDSCVDANLQVYLATVQDSNPSPEALANSRTERTRVTTASTLQAATQAERQKATTQSSILEGYLASDAPSRNVISEAQQTDADTQDLIQFMITGLAADATSSEDIRHARWLAAQAARSELIDGILYRRVPSPVDPRGELASSLRLYVPSSLRHSYLVAFHEHLCHLGVSRMSQVLRARYYWPGQSRDVATHVRECHECTLAKAPFRKPAAPKGPPVGSYPFDRVFVDVLSMAHTHDYVKGSTGYSKLLVFVDSLSRWIEAVPFNGSPNSEQVLHAYLTEVVCRHGTPRELRSDAGSNFVSVLTATILEATGTDLTPTEAHHHEGVGLVERAQQTLVGLARASNSGGKFWADHLPFYLMSMRASPNRLTRQSPSSLLYGREIRLPSQISDPRPIAEVVALDNVPEAIKEYARNLQGKLRASWEAARDATLAAQSDNVEHTTRTHDTLMSFMVGDRVCRRKPGKYNKLEYFFTGPYRVTKVLGAGKYKLSDLENRIVRDEVHVSNLKPYYTVTDIVKVQQDEYLIDSLLNRRGLGNDRAYKVKWRGYPIDQATWVFRDELMRRCADMVAEYDARPAKAPKRVGKPSLAFPSPRLIVEDTPDQQPVLESREAGRFSLRKRTRKNYRENNTVNAIMFPMSSEHECSIDKPTLKYEPLAATFVRGEWYYSIASDKTGPNWPAHIFKPFELQSTPFVTARQEEIARIDQTGQHWPFPELSENKLNETDPDGPMTRLVAAIQKSITKAHLPSSSYIAAAEILREDEWLKANRPLVDEFESDDDSAEEPVPDPTPESDSNGELLRPIATLFISNNITSEDVYWI